MNHADMVDAWLDGDAMFKEWQKEFIREWMEPVLKAQVQMGLQSIDPATMAELRKRIPNMDKGLKQEVGYG